MRFFDGFEGFVAQLSTNWRVTVEAAWIIQLLEYSITLIN
jgi:hypothetical protein